MSSKQGADGPEKVAGLFRAKQTFAFHVRGVPHMVFKGDIVRRTDPVVKGRGELFEPVELKVRDFSEILNPPRGKAVAGVEHQAEEPSETVAEGDAGSTTQEG